MSSNNNKEKIPKIINKKSGEDDATELRRGPWTLEEDNLLIKYVTCHGEGRWNSLAKFAGLKRTGKSCRLRWLNYLNPDIKRGNLSPQEQILILELHSKWGNRWSKIAQHLPGRTDNEIKNYWRTRVQKQARQLKVDSNSKKFLDTVRLFWLPRLIQKMEQNISSETSSLTHSSSSSISTVETSQKLTSSHDDSTVVKNQVSHDVIDGDDYNLDGNNACLKSEDQHERSKNLDNNPIAVKSMEDDDCYYVGFPSYSDVQELEYSFKENNLSLSGRHVDEYDWPMEDLSGSTFCTTDELWLDVF